MPAILAIEYGLSLTLFELGVLLVDHIDPALSLDDLAINTPFLH